jgi:putative Mg2+ transporter-C (MgtC) family protein
MNSSLVYFATAQYGQLLLALFLGVCLGIERSVAKKNAGMRTYGLLSMGSCLFVIIGQLSLEGFHGFSGLNPMFLAGEIIVGIGFLGGGTIIFREDHLSGLTTAAGLWVAAGVGMAVGFGYSLLAIFTTFLTLLVFTALWHLEHYFTGIDAEAVLDRHEHKKK